MVYYIHWMKMMKNEYLTGLDIVFSLVFCKIEYFGICSDGKYEKQIPSGNRHRFSKMIQCSELRDRLNHDND